MPLRNHKKCLGDIFCAKQRPEFEPGEAGVEAAKLEKFSAGVPEDASSLGWGADGSQIQWLSEGPQRCIIFGVGRRQIHTF